MAHKSLADSLSIKASRLHEQLNSTQDKVNRVLGELRQARVDANDLIGLSRHIQKKAEALADELASAPRVENEDALVEAAEQSMQQIREVAEK